MLALCPSMVDWQSGICTRVLAVLTRWATGGTVEEMMVSCMVGQLGEERGLKTSCMIRGELDQLLAANFAIKTLCTSSSWVLEVYDYWSHKVKTAGH